MAIYLIVFLSTVLVVKTAVTLRDERDGISKPLPELSTTGANPNRDITATMMRILDRLSSLETLLVDQGRKLESLEFKITKMEILNQERSSEIDRLETRISRKIDDSNSNTKQILTLMEVQRENIGSIMTNMVELRVLFSDQINDHRQEKSLLLDTAEAPNSKLQVVQTTLLNIRRSVGKTMTDMEKALQWLSQVVNVTQIIHNNTLQLVTKQYFLKNVKELQYPQSIGNVLNPSQFSSLPIFTSQISELEDLPKDCSELYQIENTTKIKSGIYRIRPRGTHVPFFVYCDMETDGGGWTVFQRRTDGMTDFFREWLDYKRGFGSLTKEFWLGNEKLYLLTVQKVCQLRVEIQDWDQQNHKYAAVYSTFSIGPESEKYYMHTLGDYSGDAGDSISYHAGHAFSTKDLDNDQWPDGNCAQSHYGAWWYNRCETSNLNGLYLSGQTDQANEGMYWYDLHGPSYSLKTSEMKIRPEKYRKK